ncbi:MAG: ATP-binding protein, partial [Armatimonadota bacterium]|nr:ATP-binding protein [Armatimonadota bacterium]
MRFFNTAGPVNPENHYCLSPLDRFNLNEIESLIGQQKYFVLHAPRQTGKTTCLLALADYLNATGDYRALYANLEGAQGSRENLTLSIPAVVEAIANSASYLLGEQDAISLGQTISGSATPGVALELFLSEWCALSSKPSILLLDEIDALVGDTLITVLRQIRAGYPRRPATFPQSVVLCGVRDIRDYRVHSSADKAIITGGSAFNIKAKS